MILRCRATQAGLLLILCLVNNDCQLRRPNTTPNRMLEPQLLVPQLGNADNQIAKSSDALPVRLLDTETQGNIGRPLLYLKPDGELTEDAVWRWSSAPEHYLDTTLNLQLSASPNLRLVDSSSAPQLAATILVWAIESQASTRLVGVVEFQVTDTNRGVRTKVIRESEAVSPKLPGDLAAAAGRLLHRIAAEGLGLVGVQLSAPGQLSSSPNRR